jgi:hypothetical protein
VIGLMIVMLMGVVIVGVVIVGVVAMRLVVVAFMIVMAQLGVRLFIAMVVNDVVVPMRLVAMLMFMVVRLVLVRLFALAVLGTGAVDDSALHPLALAAAPRIALARTAAVGAVFAFLLGLAVGAFVSLDQRLPVGDRNLVIIRMNFAEGQEAVAVAAIFDEGGLQRRFDPGDLGEIDVAAKLFALGCLEIKLFNAIAADHDDPGLLRVGGVDQHFVGHFGTHDGGGRVWRSARVARPGDATVHLIRG